MSSCPQPPCSPEELCQRVANLEKDMATVWDDIYNVQTSVYVAIGGIGVPDPRLQQFPDPTNPNRYNLDLEEYVRGSALISALNPTGVILTGDANFDIQWRSDADPDPYDFVNQEAKLTGFSSLISQKKLWPLMGDTDYWTPFDGGITPAEAAMQQEAYIRFFPYLPDARRYYAIYDKQSDTEFYFLSDGYYRQTQQWQASGSIGINGLLFVNDSLIGGPQHVWFTQRISTSTARNKVVIFHFPFVSHVSNNTDNGTATEGIKNDFYLWDLEQYGVRLIINGHSGGSSHLQRGSLHVVNASAFSRSHMGGVNTGGTNNPIEMHGQIGFNIVYNSHFPFGTVQTNSPPNLLANDVFSKNEYFQMTCTMFGIDCEFVSYDPHLQTPYDQSPLERTLNSRVVEHSFTIPSL